MNKKYQVCLTAAEREICFHVATTLDGKSRKVRRANILLKADCEKGNWPDAQIAAAYLCRESTVADVRKRFVLDGFESCLYGKKRLRAPRTKLLNGVQEARIIALRLGDPPDGYANWSLRLLSERVVALEICPAISRETCRLLLKKVA